MIPEISKLKEVRLFSRFTDDEVKMLIQVGVATKLEPYTNVVIEGELSWGLYVILQGNVVIHKENKLSGNVYEVGQLGNGSFFGEMSLIDEQPRSATVQTVTECHLFYLSKDALQGVLAKSADLKMRFYETCVQTLVKRLRTLDDDYVVSQYQLWRSALKKKQEREAA